MNATAMPSLRTPREACAAAIAVLLHGGCTFDARNILQHGGITVAHEPGEVAHRVNLRLSPRRKAEGIAGCATDAYVAALREALGGTDDEVA